MVGGESEVPVELRQVGEGGGGGDEGSAMPVGRRRREEKVGLGGAGVVKGRHGSEYLKVTCRIVIGAFRKAGEPVENTRATNAAN